MGEIQYETDTPTAQWLSTKEEDKVVIADTSWIFDKKYLCEELSANMEPLTKPFPDINRFRTPIDFSRGYYTGLFEPTMFYNEKLYEDMDYSNENYRLLGLFRVWNALEYYCPYLDILDEDWEDLLPEFIPQMLAESDQQSYDLTIAALMAKLQDAHVSFWNGDFLFEKGITYQTKCGRLTDEAIAHIGNGTNVLAAYGRNTGGPALLDFGLYIENKTYSEADTALLKQIDVQATQTHYVFQCGDVELQIDFVSPSLSEKWNMTGWPVGFLSYQVHAEDKKEHTVEILFDVDMEWMFGRRKIDSWVEQEWRFVKSDSLNLGMTADGTSFSCDDSHVVLSQKLCAENGNKGILLIGYGEGQRIHYVGELLQPLWNDNGKGEVKELMKAVGNRYQKLKEECNKLDNLWNNKAFQVGDKTFAEQILPSYRNFISSHRFVLSSDNKSFCFGDTLGNVRDAYRNFPALLFFNRVDWMKSLLNPIFEYCEDEHWKRKYPPYDIGLYPVASKQIKVDNCAEEAAANMLMMMVAIVEAEQDFSYAELHWSHLCLWANYLEEKMKGEVLPSIELLDANDKRVKCVLGLMAYHKLIQLKDAYE